MKIEIKCDFIDIQSSQQGKNQSILFKIRGVDCGLYEKLNNLQENAKNGLRLVVDGWHEKRSLDANAYFHVLVHEIAKILNIGDEECKQKMVLDYGEPAVTENGDKVIVKLPANVNIDDFYKYAKWLKSESVKGYEVNYYLFYKQTHKLDTKEMARLIDGTVWEAQKLGIETKTPNELAKIKASWENE